jgi:hypothetical protein
MRAITTPHTQKRIKKKKKKKAFFRSLEIKTCDWKKKRERK